MKAIRKFFTGDDVALGLVLLLTLAIVARVMFGVTFTFPELPRAMPEFRPFGAVTAPAPESPAPVVPAVPPQTPPKSPLAYCPTTSAIQFPIGAGISSVRVFAPCPEDAQHDL